MISIAEYKKSEYGGKITLEKFIKIGIEICNNINTVKFQDVYDKIKLNYYIFVLQELLKKSKKM
jgi:hypothetical protein